MTWRKYITKEFIILVLVQYVGFKISWLATAYGAKAGPPYSYYGSAAFFGFLALHVAYYRRLWELWFALSVAVFGTAIDTVYHLTGFITYNGMYPVVDFIAPIWISALWAGLAVTLDYSLKVLVGRPFWMFLIGAIFGPLAYWSGDSIGAIHFQYGVWETMAIMAVPWGLAMIVCYWILEYWRPKPVPADAAPVVQEAATVNR